LLGLLNPERLDVCERSVSRGCLEVPRERTVTHARALNEFAHNVATCVIVRNPDLLLSDLGISRIWRTSLRQT
jgi:hypothetical protein